MTRLQGVVYLRNTIIKPAFQQLAYFFAQYDCYSTVIDSGSTNIKQGIKYIPAGNIQIYCNKKLLFEYRLRFILEPEDQDSLLIDARSKMGTVMLEKYQSCPMLRQKSKELYGFVVPYPTLFVGERVTTLDLLNDFAQQYHQVMGNIVVW